MKNYCQKNLNKVRANLIPQLVISNIGKKEVVPKSAYTL